MRRIARRAVRFVVGGRGETHLAVALVLYGAIAGIHIWLGHNPFLGTYG